MVTWKLFACNHPPYTLYELLLLLRMLWQTQMNRHHTAKKLKAWQRLESHSQYFTAKVAGVTEGEKVVCWVCQKWLYGNRMLPWFPV